MSDFAVVTPLHIDNNTSNMPRKRSKLGQSNLFKLKLLKKKKKEKLYPKCLKIDSLCMSEDMHCYKYTFIALSLP